MPINDFKPFAAGPGANVTSQADWENLPALLSGFMSGKASSAQINKAFRQVSFIAAALAQFVSEKTDQDVLDDGDLPGFVEKLTAGFAAQYLSRSNPFGDIASDGEEAIATALSNLHLAEAGNNSGKLALIGNTKTDNDKCAVIVKTGSNANGKYRIWSDGSIDMWGNGIANVNGDALVNYPIALPAAAQNVTTTPLVLSTGTNRPTTSVMVVTDLTTATKATFIVKRSDGSTSADGFYWSVNYAAF